MHAVLVNLLVVEEDRLGFDVEQLAKAQQYIDRCKEHIDRQCSEIAQMQREGRDSSQAQALLREPVCVACSRRSD
jgi:hypothetical protein